MALTSWLDKGASLGPDAPCLTLDGTSLSYGDVVDLSHRVARALRRSGVRPGDKVGILSANDPVAFACVFGIARAGADRSAAGIRSEVGSPETNSVDKGAITRDIIAAPEGDGQDARASAGTAPATAPAPQPKG